MTCVYTLLGDKSTKTNSFTVFRCKHDLDFILQNFRFKPFERNCILTIYCLKNVEDREKLSSLNLITQIAFLQHIMRVYSTKFRRTSTEIYKNLG